jgi:hypothetical protein
MARLLIVLAVAGGFAIWLYLERRARAAGRDLLARVRAGFLHASEGAAAEGPGREVGDPAGLVRFRVPESWREEHQPDGAAIFHDAASGERVLRLSILSMERPGRARAEDVAFDLGALRPRAESALATLPDGRLLLKHVDAGSEDGRALVLYTWRLVRPDGARHAVFTLAVPAEAALDVLTADDVRRVERAVRAATIA